jgi:hypothetical protein
MMAITSRKDELERKGGRDLHLMIFLSLQVQVMECGTSELIPVYV